jgi:hypothetical protein
MRDTYDFVNRPLIGEIVLDQWLGRWDCHNEKWEDSPLHGNTVRNSDFEGYRQRTSQGGDFEIFTPLRHLPLVQPVSTFCPASAAAP